MPRAKKIKHEEPKEELEKEKVFAFGVFDQQKNHYIRGYCVSEFKNVEELAEGFASKETKETQKKQLRDEPDKYRSIVNLSKEEYDKWEDIKQQEQIAYEQEFKRKAEGIPRSVFYGKEGEIKPF